MCSTGHDESTGARSVQQVRVWDTLKFIDAEQGEMFAIHLEYIKSEAIQLVLYIQGTYYVLRSTLFLKIELCVFIFRVYIGKWYNCFDLQDLFQN